MIEDALTYDQSRRLEGDVVIIGSGLSAMAVASRLVGHNKRVIVFESGGNDADRDEQRKFWDGQVTATNGTASDLHPPAHMGRVRALGGASTVWVRSGVGRSIGPAVDSSRPRSRRTSC